MFNLLEQMYVPVKESDLVCPCCGEPLEDPDIFDVLESVPWEEYEPYEYDTAQMSHD